MQYVTGNSRNHRHAEVGTVSYVIMSMFMCCEVASSKQEGKALTGMLRLKGRALLPRQCENGLHCGMLGWHSHAVLTARDA